MEARTVPYDEARALTLALSEEMVLRYGGGEEGPGCTTRVSARSSACTSSSPLGGGDCRGCCCRRWSTTPALWGCEVWLETGSEQPEALGLYESAGFLPIPPYGDHKDDERSRCYCLAL